MLKTQVVMSVTHMQFLIWILEPLWNVRTLSSQEGTHIARGESTSHVCQKRGT